MTVPPDPPPSIPSLEAVLAQLEADAGGPDPEARAALDELRAALRRGGGAAAAAPRGNQEDVNQGEQAALAAEASLAAAARALAGLDERLAAVEAAAARLPPGAVALAARAATEAGLIGGGVEKE